MSTVCASEYSGVLKIVANQPETIEKIKSQFDNLVNMVDEKLIEPTFVSIATHNSDMGDWIIQKFISTEGLEKFAALCGKIIICDKQKVVHRLRILL